LTEGIERNEFGLTAVPTLGLMGGESLGGCSSLLSRSSGSSSLKSFSLFSTGICEECCNYPSYRLCTTL